MDQAILVNEAISDGTQLIAGFDQFMPVKAAFWLRRAESNSWYLYIASEQLEDANIRRGYAEVLRLAQELGSPYLDPFQVKLIPADDPLAEAAVQIYQRYPGKLPIRYNNTNLGRIRVEGVYFYPTPVTLPSD